MREPHLRAFTVLSLTSVAPPVDSKRKQPPPPGPLSPLADFVKRFPVPTAPVAATSMVADDADSGVSFEVGVDLRATPGCDLLTGAYQCFGWPARRLADKQTISIPTISKRYP
jgi:hypothetical protein